MRDVTERSMADAEMAYRATHDPVTGLPNRYLFDDRLKQALARDRREPETLAVLFCDVDGLKGINDRLGHAVGDQVLMETARRIEAVIRPGRHRRASGWGRVRGPVREHRRGRRHGRGEPGRARPSTCP